jgi:multiple sugar transport system permease protein
MWITIVLLCGWAIASLFPLYWMFLTSLKTGQQAQALPPNVWVTNPTLDSYRRVLSTGYPVLRWLLNSFQVATTVTVLSLLICAAAGYAFARKRFRGRNVLFFIVLASIMLPGFSRLIPLFMLTLLMGLHDTYWALILPGLASPYAVFLMRQFMVTLPSELFDQARIDGAGEIRIWWQIVMPLTKPAIAALSTFTFVGNWNDFVWPLVVMNKKEMMTLPVGVTLMRGMMQTGYNDYPIAMAAGVITAIVPVVIFFFFQQYFVRGLTVGAVKG